MQSLNSEQIYSLAEQEVVTEDQLAIFGGKIGPDGSNGENMQRANEFLKTNAKSSQARIGLISMAITYMTKPVSILVCGITKADGKGDRRHWSAEAFRALPQLVDSVDREDSKAVAESAKIVSSRISRMASLAARHGIRMDDGIVEAYARVNSGAVKALAFLGIFNESRRYDGRTLSSFRLSHFPDGDLTKFDPIVNKRNDSATLVIFKEDFSKFKRAFTMWKAMKDSGAESRPNNSAASLSEVFLNSDTVAQPAQLKATPDKTLTITDTETKPKKKETKA